MSESSIQRMSSVNYLLSDSPSELERLALQARVWEPETEAWLDHIGPMTGWRCLDLGCGTLGIIGPLARRAGPSGRVVGLDVNAKLLAAARVFVTESGLGNIELMQADAYATKTTFTSFVVTQVSGRKAR